MKLFLSWSKKYSGQIAAALKEWLERPFSGKIDICFSKEIDGGEKWEQTNEANLRDSAFGILVLTPENVNSPWLLFEAGFISAKSDKESCLCPILFGRSAGELEAPIRGVQALDFTKKDFARLLAIVNKKSDLVRDDDYLKIYLEATWSDFEEKLNPMIENARIAKSRLERGEVSDQGVVFFSADKMFQPKLQGGLKKSLARTA